MKIRKLKFRLFCDMDGVLTDLDGAVKRLGKGTTDDLNNIGGSKRWWDVVNSAGLEFWSKMDWMENGRDFWKFVKPYRPILLSAYHPYGKHVLGGKKIWIKENLGIVPYILCLREEKQKCSDKNSILIDDRRKNIDEWESQGGIGILYHDSVSQNIKEITRKLLE